MHGSQHSVTGIAVLSDAGSKRVLTGCKRKQRCQFKLTAQGPLASPHKLVQTRSTSLPHPATPSAAAQEAHEQLCLQEDGCAA